MIEVGIASDKPWKMICKYRVPLTTQEGGGELKSGC
jgi:hypothetical protein